MIINVQGVLVDGSAPPLNATPTRSDQVVYQGQDVSVVVTVVGSNGAALNLTGYTGALVVKDRVLPTSGLPQWNVSYAADTTNAALGVLAFTVPGTDLKAMRLQSYWWDVFVTSGAGKRDEVVPTGLLTVWPAVGA